MEEGTLKNIVDGVRIWVNDKITRMSFVISSHIVELKNQVDNKQDIISDLSSIREGASKGRTSDQSRYSDWANLSETV